MCELNSLFIFDNQALEVGGNLVSLGMLPFSLEGQMGLVILLIDLSDSNQYVDIFPLISIALDCQT